jgi:hypothetical protein
MARARKLERASRAAARVVTIAAAVVSLTAGRRNDHAARATLDPVRNLPAMVVLAPSAGWPSALLQGINLSSLQRARLDSIRTAYAARINFGPPPSSTAPSAPLSWGAMLQLRMEQRNAIRAVLTPPQRAVFDANAQRIRDRIQIRVPPEPHGVRRLLRYGLG